MINLANRRERAINRLKAAIARIESESLATLDLDALDLTTLESAGRAANLALKFADLSREIIAYERVREATP